MYRIRAFISRGLYIFTPFWKTSFFHKILFLFMVSIQERVMMARVQVILFEIDCPIFYTNLHELFFQFISWTNWINSCKFMDNCWISCKIMKISYLDVLTYTTTLPAVTPLIPPALFLPFTLLKITTTRWQEKYGLIKLYSPKGINFMMMLFTYFGLKRFYLRNFG